MDIKIAGQPDVTPEQKTVEANYTQTIPEGILLQEQIGQLFDFKHSEIESYKTELNTLIDYAKKKTDDHSPNGLKWALTDLGLKLGTPPMGEKRIKQLVRYAYLWLETRKHQEELTKMLRGEEEE
jgi:hypothetical protein